MIHHCVIVLYIICKDYLFCGNNKPEVIIPKLF
jgi:hypothetical protein